MSNFLKDFWQGIVGGGGGDINWDELTKLMEFETQLNRTDREGALSSWDWEEDPETGRWKQTQTLQPQLQMGADRMLQRYGEDGPEAYQSPGQFSTMLDSAMAAQMQRQGSIDPNMQVQHQGQFQPSADRQGGFTQGFVPNMPPGQMGPANPQGGGQNPDLPPDAFAGGGSGGRQQYGNMAPR